ncbi:E3 ubiquitin-protein ligase Iruka-like [Sabethes cyaneus]|uniref:E3 ubiquitin-protein ligase Iruka-like n=1 Tax=Sabethes cyaneus TaxID=53552 RepID=UPI00237DCFFB|nr:E3 ubiquitin-protein ligase Iruka-like [Sabethes cyaneus]
MDALVENSSNAPSRFYCHSCSVEIDRVSSDFTCPHCLEGFIEELPAAERNTNPPSPPPAPSDSDSNTMDYMNPQAIRLATDIFSNSILSPLLLSTGGAGDSRATDSEAPASLGDDGGDSAAGGATGGNAGGPYSMRLLGRHRNRRRGVQNINNLDNILREILISVADGANGGAGGTPMFFMGNPGDYAWGREGLDTIVTQLLNQMDNTGPPPLEKEKIAEIPKVTISSEQVDMKLQCSVCWEDFQIDEVVRKLSCAHIYHETCIIPWLELHGTCPICRKSLAPEQQPDEQRGLAAAANAVANTLRSLHSDAFPGAASQLSASSSADVNGPSTSSLLVELGQPFFSLRANNPSQPRPSGSRSSSTLSSAQQQTQNSSSGQQAASTTTTTATDPPGAQPASSRNNGTDEGGNGSSSGTNRYRFDDGNIDYEFD